MSMAYCDGLSVFTMSGYYPMIPIYYSVIAVLSRLISLYVVWKFSDNMRDFINEQLHTAFALSRSFSWNLCRSVNKTDLHKIDTAFSSGLCRSSIMSVWWSMKLGMGVDFINKGALSSLSCFVRLFFVHIRLCLSVVRIPFVLVQKISGDTL